MGSLLFVIGGIYMLWDAENFTSLNPLVIRIIGTAAILFFGFGVFVSIKWLVKDQVVLVIDSKGININPKKSLSERIEWENIEGFSEIKIHGTKIIVINVNNPNHWIEQEENVIRKRMMKFNLSYCKSPFNISANATQLSHIELMKMLNKNLQKYSPSFGRICNS